MVLRSSLFPAGGALSWREGRPFKAAPMTVVGAILSLLPLAAVSWPWVRGRWGLYPGTSRAQNGRAGMPWWQTSWWGWPSSALQWAQRVALGPPDRVYQSLWLFGSPASGMPRGPLTVPCSRHGQTSTEKQAGGFSPLLLSVLRLGSCQWNWLMVPVRPPNSM